MSSPSGWQELWDEQTGSFYYCNQLDQSSQWEKPEDSAGRPVPYQPLSSEKRQSMRPIEGDIETGMGGINPVPESSSTRRKSPLNPMGPWTHQRSTDEEDELGTRHDYIGMARIYKVEAAYREKRKEVRCILCFQNLCSEVFFPCEHMCVCSPCIRKERISAESDVSSEEDFCHCPLCNQAIKLILPFDQGKEVDRYWSWVYQVTPPLPKDFLRGFKHSAAVIQKVYIDERGADSNNAGTSRRRRETSGSCLTS